MSSCVEEKLPLLNDKTRSDEYIQMNETRCSRPLPTATSNVGAAPKERLASLDQYRGFVILCSLIVPLFGRINAAPAVFKHESNFFSIAGQYNLHCDSASSITTPCAPYYTTFSKQKKPCSQNINLYRKSPENA